MTEESLVDKFFLPCVIDDKMEVMRIIDNSEIISKLEYELKDTKLENSRKLLQKNGIFKEQNKKFKLYSHSFYSDGAVSFIEGYVKSSREERDRIKKLIEDKVNNFFKLSELNELNDYSEPEQGR